MKAQQNALQSREHIELMEMFEKSFSHMRLDKESRDMWPRGIIYQHGEVNQLFLAYRLGYSFGVFVGMDGEGEAGER